MQACGTGLAHVGRLRSTNEDCWLADDHLGLYIVADGMGGARAGEVASATAVETVAHVLRSAGSRLEAARAEPTSQALEDLVEEAVQTACKEVFRLSTENIERTGMGCTLTLLLISEGRGTMAHVGDSRLYVHRNNGVHQLSQDHTVTAEMVRQGVLTEEKARTNRFRNVLSRALGTQPAVQIDTLSFDMLPQDRFLLCSDGFANYIPNLDWLSHELGREEAGAVVGELVRFANDAGGADNITVLLVEIEDATGDLQSTQERMLLLEVMSTHRLFEDLTLYQKVTVLRHCEVRDLAPHETLVSEGAPLPGLAIIVRGQLEAVRDQKVQRTWKLLEAFGLSSLLLSPPAPETIRASRKTRVLILPRNGFSVLTRMRPALGVTLLRRLGTQFAEQVSG